MASLTISIAAAFTSAVSLVISYLGFQRDRPRVIATIRREHHGKKEAGAFLLHIRLVNSGAQAVQVDTRRFETKGSAGQWGLSQGRFAGPGVPASLNGYSSIDWWVDVRDVSEQLASKDARIRATISLGSGKVVTSSWMAPMLAQDREVQEELDKRLTIPFDSSKGPDVIW